ncbi:MAG: ATPase, T2SS/T4P/T4SS family [Gammaproteobacteria bacterium]|jgi:type IV pilus assembly protein PilB
MPKQIEKFLLQQKLINEDKLQHAKKAANQSQQTLITYLAKNRMIAANQLVHAVTQEFHLPSVDLLQYSVDKLPLNLAPIKLITRTNILPLQQRSQQLDVALIDPHDVQAVNLIKFHTGMRINIFIARYDHLQKLMQQIITRYNTQELGVLHKSIDTPYDYYHLNLEDRSDEPLIAFINHTIEDAVNNHVSDIHFEVYEQYCRVRFRQDGILREITKPSVRVAARIISRLKIMAKLDISEKRLPQDGHCKIKIKSNQVVEIRVSSCPTVFGEKIVLRLLNSDNILRNIHQLGFDLMQQKDFVHAISQPQGLVLVTGPTGSGKTVTLYAALQYLNKVEKNIITIEDPVEINLADINQVNAKNKTGLTFAHALRAFLRQDPDIIMVGEIRDLETAEIALKAAQTGHLVISTLHTNSATEALTRLRNMGVAPYNIIGSVNLITAQRLVRKLCSHCKREYKVSALLSEQLGFAADSELYKAVGCEYCVDGYSGRMAIHEVLKIDAAEEFRTLCEACNFISLRKAGLNCVLQGETSLQEIYRVMGD